MPGKSRPNGRRYFYRNFTIDGRERSIYLGHGLAAEEAARQKEEEKALAQKEREELRTLRESTAAMTRPLD